MTEIKTSAMRHVEHHADICIVGGGLSGLCAALAAAPFVATFISAISGILELIAINVLGDSFAGVVCLIIGVPGLVIGLLLLARNVKETNNIDIEAVRLN